jgi:hypothetical protein
MTPLETLKAARDLISDPARWTQGAFARDATGAKSRLYLEQAVCFCAVGAIRRVYVPPVAIGSLLKQLPKDCQTLGHFNDTHTHAEVLALFDAAIAELEVVAT